MKKFIQSLLLTCYYYGVGLIYCSILSIMMVVDTMRFGTAVWKEKNRKKNSPPSNNKIWTPPERRDDPEITWKHGYVQTEDLRFHFVASGEIPSHLKINEIDGETTLLKQGSSDRPNLLLCLHGFPESWYSWRYVLKNFEENPRIESKDESFASYFVVAVDLRGFGNSDHPSGIGSYHRNKLAADVKLLTQSLGYEKCTLLTHDWGGVIAWHVVEYFPEVIERLIVLNCPHPKAGLGFALKSVKQLLVGSWYMYVFMVPFFPEIYIRFNNYAFIDMILKSKEAGIQSLERALSDDELEFFKFMLGKEIVSCGINYYRALLLPFYQPKPLPKKLESVDAKFPILLLWGDKDAFMNKQMAEMTKSYLPSTSPRSRVVMIENASHWLQQDKPEEVIKHLREFLSE